MNFLNYTLLLLLYAVTLNPLSADAIGDDDTFIINNKVQEIEFFVDGKEGIKAKLKVELEVQSTSALEYSYTNSVFVDDYTYVDGIYYKEKKKTRRIHAELSDYEIDGIFHSDAKVYYFDYNFDRQDQIVTFSYTKVFEDLKFLNKLFFGDSYKVKNSSITIKVPNYMNAGVIKWHFDKADIIKDVSRDKDNKIYNYVQKDVEPTRLYRNEPSASKTRPHLIIIPKSYTHKGKETRLMKETSDLYAWYHSLVKQLEDEPNELSSLVTKLTEDASSDTEKIKNIFYWVQDNIRYIAFEDGIMGFKPETCQEVYANKYGDCKGMANLTKNMLELAGYDARLTWLGTKSIPYSYSMPSLMVDNHMICTVFLDGKEIFLDATEKHSDLATYAYRIEGKEVMIENGDDFLLKTIPVADLSTNIESYDYNLKIDDDKLKGEGKLKIAGTRKTWIYNVLNSYKTAKREEILQSYIDNDDKNVVIDLGDAKVDLSRDNDFTFDYEVRIDNQITKIADELYINLEFDNTYKSYDIPEDRKRPLTLNQSYFIQTDTQLEVPAGLSVSYLPESVNIVNDKYEFLLSYNKEGNTIVYSKSIKIKSPIIETEEFDAWNKAIKALNDFYSDQIILNK